MATVVVTEIVENRINPFPADFVTIRSLLALSKSPEVGALVKAVDPTATFTVFTTEFREAPIITVSVSAPTATTSEAVYQVITERLDEYLTWLQDQEQVGPDLRTELRVLLEPAEPALSVSSMLRPLAGVVILGAGLAVGAAVAVESLMSARRRGRRGAQPNDDDGSVVGNPDDRNSGEDLAVSPAPSESTESPRAASARVRYPAASVPFVLLRSSLRNTGLLDFPGIGGSRVAGHDAGLDCPHLVDDLAIRPGRSRTE